MITRLAVSTDATEGLNRTLTVQDAFTAMLPLQVVVLEKSVLAAAGAPPAMAEPVNPIGERELFVKVTVCAALAVPITRFPNERLRGETANTG